MKRRMKGLACAFAGLAWAGLFLAHPGGVKAATLFEPPSGIVIHGFQEGDSITKPYLTTAITASSRSPAMANLMNGFPSGRPKANSQDPYGVFEPNPPTAWDPTDNNPPADSWQEIIDAELAAGRFLTLSFDFHKAGTGGLVETMVDIVTPGATYEYPPGTTLSYATLISKWAALLNTYNQPFLARLGFEFNGYSDSSDFVAAYQHIVDAWRAAGVDNVAYSWCFVVINSSPWPDPADNDYEAFYPGDTYVDWGAIDPFAVSEFNPALPNTVTDGSGTHITVKGWTEKFLEFCRSRRKPVHLGEMDATGCGGDQIDITAGTTDGENDWDHWFIPWHTLLDTHSEIKGFNYINTDWNGAYCGWQDARIGMNPEVIVPRWNTKLAESRMINNLSPGAKPTANFSASSTSGAAPFTVKFTGSSSNSPFSTVWNFDGGTSDSVARDPSFTFFQPGTYSVKMSATNAKGFDGENKANYITVTGNKQIWQAAAEFSGTQGGNNWYYKEWTGSSHVNMAWNTLGFWYGVNDANCFVAGPYQIPNVNASERAWQSPATGILRLTGEISKVYSGGDGVTVSILQNSTTVMGPTSISGTDLSPKPFDVFLNIATNDIVYFRVSRNSTSDYDAVVWDPQVKFAKLWDGASQFSSTQGANQWLYQEKAFDNDASDNHLTTAGWNHPNMTYNSGGGYWQGSDASCQVKQLTQQPSSGLAAERVWESSVAGVAWLVGIVAKDATGGDGVTASIYVNSILAWTSPIAANDTTGVIYAFPVQVEAGDSVYFRVDKGASTATSDSTAWIPYILF